MGRGNIVFIGGIHGSGKGAICSEIVRNSHFEHLTASEVLKWNELSPIEAKIVLDIDQTQNRLIYNLNQIVKSEKDYLLDGHYCLLNKFEEPEKIPLNTFSAISPSKLILVTADPDLIEKRLHNRDSVRYSVDLISRFQNLEISYANEISLVMEIPLLIIDSELFDLNTITSFLLKPH